jgi:hypothetical protein
MLPLQAKRKCYARGGAKVKKKCYLPLLPFGEVAFLFFLITFARASQEAGEKTKMLAPRRGARGARGGISDAGRGGGNNKQNATFSPLLQPLVLRSIFIIIFPLLLCFLLLSCLLLVPRFYSYFY